MDVQRRDLLSHVTLVFYEFSLVPLSFLATFFVLLLVGGVLSAAQFAGVGSTALDPLTTLITVAMVVGLSLTGGTIVRGYQRFFDRSFGGLDPLRICAIPLLAFIATTGYAVGSLGTITPPWWVSLVAILSVHALVFRAIAVYSMRDGAKRTGARVGSIAAIPAVLALVTLVTQEVLDVGMNGAGQLVIATLAITGIPHEAAPLVLAPIVVGAAYGLSTREAVVPTDRPTLSLPISIDRSILDRQWWPSGSDRSSRASAGSSNRNRSSEAPPPSSPHTNGSTGRSSSGSAGRSDSSPRSAFRGGGGGSKSPDKHDSSPPQSRGSSASSGSDAQARADPSPGRTEDEPNDASSSDAPAASATDSTNTPSAAATDGTGSETRIFTDDFGEFTGGGGSVEACPSCDTDVPSDSAYCPQCGTEL